MLNLVDHGFYHLSNMTDLFLQVKGWAIQLFIINKTGVSVQSRTMQSVPIHFIHTFQIHLNVNGLTLVNVSFEIIRTEWLQLRWPPGSMPHLIQHWQLQNSQLKTHIISYLVHLYSNNCVSMYSPIQWPSLLSGITAVVDAVVRKCFSFIWQRLPVHWDGQLEKDRGKHYYCRNMHTLIWMAEIIHKGMLAPQLSKKEINK